MNNVLAAFFLTTAQISPEHASTGGAGLPGLLAAALIAIVVVEIWLNLAAWRAFRSALHWLGRHAATLLVFAISVGVIAAAMQMVRSAYRPDGAEALHKEATALTRRIENLEAETELLRDRLKEEQAAVRQRTLRVLSDMGYDEEKPLPAVEAVSRTVEVSDLQKRIVVNETEIAAARKRLDTLRNDAASQKEVLLARARSLLDAAGQPGPEPPSPRGTDSRGAAHAATLSQGSVGSTGTLGFVSAAGDAASESGAAEELQAISGDLQLLDEMLQGPTQAEESLPKTNVSVHPLRATTIEDVLTLPAVAEAVADIMLAARNDGTVEWIGPEEGDRVEAGQPLMRIDEESLRAALESARAAEKLASVNVERARDLFERKVMSRGELDRAESEWRQADAALTVARKNLSDATLSSRIDGVVDEIVPDAGEYVNRGEVVIRLVDRSTIKLNVSAPEKDVAFFKVGQTARVLFPEPYEGFTTGTIHRIGLVADEMSRTFLVEVRVDNGEGIFRPGMIGARVALMRQQRDAALVVPFFAVLQTEDGPIVYVEQDGVARAKSIAIGIRQGTHLEVTRGLEPGERLIVEGHRLLNDGSPVRVVEVRDDRPDAAVAQTTIGR